ncbi:putative inactive disease susceptibility protein LOV1 isoform X2 [Solanum tuberosum]|uniref:putative inactive disease susceptibility protein LOV1 isoform X2 n=1 Tax=Solanum tuberosum TaxID=4113 RepID=UPI00073A2AF5|nr:PREDICTED: putative inactive disease susceptibility protein LOV1 isoform X2 [Solanum tuberosum]
MAAQAVSNFLRKLKAFPMYKVDTRISEELRDIEKVFSLLLPHVQNAEWDELINREKEQEGRKSNDRVDISELNTWHWSVAVCAAEVEQIFIMYNFHMYNLFNTPTFYMKFLYSCHFKTDSNNVADKIRNCLSILSRSIRASPMIQAIFTLDQTSVEDCVLLLSKVSEVLTSPEMTELLLNLERTVYRQHQQWSLGNLLSNNGSTTSQIRMNFESAHMEGQVKDAIFLESAHMIDQAKEVKLFGGWSYAKGEEFLAINRSHQHQLVDMVGREEEVKLLEGWLLAKEEECPDIITISGEAGIGKTTVAEAVYEQGQKDFDCHAWVFVSKNDSTRRVMQNILKGILKSISVMAPYNIDTMGEKPLKKLINSWLIGKKFLLILDDIPSWEIVEVVTNVMPRGREKTRILVTSRVSNELNEYKLCKLKSVDSYHLLHKHACTSERGDEFFSSVDSVAKDIVRLSCGLPLAIVTVGRMLSTKHTAEDWIKVHQMFLRGACFMSLCYADLSPELQSCFLYAASFPCHFEISCKKMKRLWIAEDFVQHEDNRTLEESAQDQLDELIHRNMIQVVKRNIDGRVKTCRILRRMRKFALRRSEGDHFTVILPSLKRAFPERCHRAFLYGASYDGTSTSKFSRKDFSGLYSFLALELNQHQAPLNLNDFRLLCVLELQGFCHESLPDAIGDLSLLRYLGLRSGKIKKLPVSLKKLQRLQTLDIRDTVIRDLPDDLEGWQKLRHLLLERSFTDKVVNLRDGIIEAFIDLQTLAGLKMTEAIAKGLINLRGIRKLSIGAVQGLHLLPLFKAVERMEFLRSFTMKGSFEDESYKFPFPQLYSLEKLCIGGPMMNNLLDWVGKLHYVKSLYLWDSKLTKDPLRSLQHLSNLMVLSLCNSYDGKNIEFGHEGFPKLKKLSILHCQNLKSWEEIPHGAMTKLETLNFGYCPSLVELPKGLDKLNSLCSIEVSNMSSQFMQYVHELQSISRLSISIRGTVQ